MLPEGTVVDWLGVSNDGNWHLIRQSNGYEGWVEANLSKPVDTNLADTVPVMTIAPTSTRFRVTSTQETASTDTPTPPPTDPPSNEEMGVVTNIMDGDTIHVLIDGQDYPVRHIGIDTPE